MHFIKLLTASLATFASTAGAAPITERDAPLRIGGTNADDAWKNLDWFPDHISYTHRKDKKKALNAIIADHNRVITPSLRLGDPQVPCNGNPRWAPCFPCRNSGCRAVEYPEPYFNNPNEWTKHWYRLSIKLAMDKEALTPKQQTARLEQKIKDMSKFILHNKEPEVE